MRSSRSLVTFVLLEKKKKTCPIFDVQRKGKRRKEKRKRREMSNKGKWNCEAQKHPNGYILFCEATRETIENEDKKFTPQQIFATQGALWRRTTPAQKKFWRKLSERKAGKMNNYMLFLKAFRDSVRLENPSRTPQEITSIVGRWWNELTPAQKSWWKEQAAVNEEEDGEENGDDDDDEMPYAPKRRYSPRPKPSLTTHDIESFLAKQQY